VVVATSNRPPDDLYKDGLNRAIFLPCIRMLKDRVDLVELDAMIDYRQNLGDAGLSYFTPLGPVASAGMEAAWRRETRGEPTAPVTLSIHGRRVRISQATDDVGRASFEELCENPLGASDYLAIAERFATFFIDAIPKLQWAQNNEAKRFVTLIDAFYEARMRLYCTAEVPPEEIYTEGAGAFEFDRTVSRLAEMQSAAWMSPSLSCISDCQYAEDLGTRD
jgi:cell division protein ZapE